MRAGTDDVTDMVGRRQAICHGDAGDLERRDTDNSKQWRRCNLMLPFGVDEDDFFQLRSVKRQVVGLCPRLNVFDLGGPRDDVAGRNDEVCVFGELDELVSGGLGFQVASISHVRCRPNARLRATPTTPQFSLRMRRNAPNTTSGFKMDLGFGTGMPKNLYVEKFCPKNVILTRLRLILCHDNAYNGRNRDFTLIFMFFPKNMGYKYFFTILTPKRHFLTPKRIF